jgi:hypothetical protein
MACIHLQKSDIASEEQQFPKNISIFFAALAKEPMKDCHCHWRFSEDTLQILIELKAYGFKH